MRMMSCEEVQTRLNEEKVSVNEGEEEPINMSQQILRVREGLAASLREGDTWNVLSCDWVERWKRYVNFDGVTVGEATFPPPGPVENSLLLEEQDDVLGSRPELNKSCVEGSDYILLPSQVYYLLKRVYGSDVDIERSVIMVGKNDTHRGSPHIELYPVRINAIVIQADAEESLAPVKAFYFSRLQSLLHASQTIMQDICPQASQRTRFWTRCNNESESICDQSRDSRVEFPSPRKLTAERTDLVDGFLYLRNFDPELASNSSDMSLEAAVESQSNSLDLVLEIGSLDPKDEQQLKWPWDSKLMNWTTSLQEGDEIDASDNCGTWFEGVVREVTKGQIFVHFKGWGNKFDETIESNSFSTRIAPLYTKTPNWRKALTKGSEIDFTKRIKENGSIWFPAIVTRVDEETAQISVKYKQEHEIVMLCTDLDLNGEQICMKGTHVTNSKWEFHDESPTNLSVSRDISSHKAVNTVGYSSYHSAGSPVVSGAVGLANLGNTCFMNCTLQCLSNTQELTSFFRENKHLDQLNLKNPLGHKGELATAYGKLLNDIWSDKYVAVRPDEFKRSIGEFAPQFSGYQQHDSSELMMFLLDGLHEDMNRIYNKPAVEKIESKGRDDNLISAESWRRYLLRNDSILVDLCFGQLRSHVTCTGCGFESVTFDEYSSLSLPLPMKNTRSLTFIVYPLPLGTRPLKVTISANVEATVEEISSLIRNSQVFKKSQRKRSELGKRKKIQDSQEEASSYVMVDNDSFDPENDIKEGMPSSESCVGIENLGDITIETDSEDAVLVNDSSESASSDSSYMHLCLMSSMLDNIRVQKTYTPNEYIRDSVGSNTSLAAYEMDADIPHDNSMTGTSRYSYFDLFVGVRKKLSQYPKSHACGANLSRHLNDRDKGFKTFDFPMRIPFETGVTTKGEMNERIFGAMKRAYDLPDDFSISNLPYTIHATSLCANISKRVIDLADDESSPFSIFLYECLICCWNEDCLDDDADTNSTEMENDSRCIVDPLVVQRWLSDGINGTEPAVKDSNRREVLSVMDCFEKFVEREQMPEEETWYCPNCKQHLAPLKKFDIWSAPNILVIHLKRFHYSSRSTFTFREKMNDLVEFPIEGLDLSGYVKSSLSSSDENPAIYDLYGVSEHSGSMAGGHYTSKCKNPVDGKWYFFNDSHVRECAAESAISREAYVLFYRRRVSHEKWGGLVPSEKPLEK